MLEVREEGENQSPILSSLFGFRQGNQDEDSRWPEFGQFKHRATSAAD